MGVDLSGNSNFFATSDFLEKLLLSKFMLIFVSVFSAVGVSFSLPLFDLDEGAFSAATREMIESGNWVSTYLNGVPRHDKPILIYWFQAVSVNLFGLSEFSLRLPSILASMVWIYSVHHFCKQVFDTRIASLSVWLLSSCWLTTIIFKSATADALLNSIICLTFFQIYYYISNPRSWRLVWIGVLMGLGFLTKGPVAVVLPALSSLITLAILSKEKVWLRAVVHPYTWGMFLLIVLPWHIAVYLDQGYEFFKGFYLGHNLNRFSETRESHGGKIYYYLLLLPFLLLPFNRWMWQVFKSIRVIHKNELNLFLFVWFALVFVIFSLSKTQLPHYLLYGFTPLVILIASRMSFGQSVSVNKRFIEYLFMLLGLFLFVALPFFLKLFISSTKNAYDLAVVTTVVETFYSGYHWLAFLIILFCVYLILFSKVSHISKALSCSVGILLGVNFVLAPVIASAQQAPVKSAALYIKDLYSEKGSSERDGVNIIAYRIDMPSFSVYLDQVVPKASPKYGDLVFTRIDKYQKLNSINSEIIPREIFSEGGIVLYQYGESK